MEWRRITAWSELGERRIAESGDDSTVRVETRVKLEFVKLEFGRESGDDESRVETRECFE